MATTTHHAVHFDDAGRMSLRRGSVQLVVTSPPYPMIEMWDDGFVERDPEIRESLDANDGWNAFERMHAILDVVWKRVARVLVDGGIACINVGDATRSMARLGGPREFALYSNHVRIASCFRGLGFTPLPVILWRKQTNAPNKFMGSGMLPPGAYVTLEHEYVLVFRKGDKRALTSDAAKANRRASAYFWEERNDWFSDVWFDLKGSRQALADRETRARSGAFPFELPYRLINMFSVKGDTVLDPFAGIGTTALAAMATARSSIGYEIDESLLPAINKTLEQAKTIGNERIDERLRAHAEFVRRRHETKGRFGYRNAHYGFPVVTRQETGLLLNRPSAVTQTDGGVFEVDYAEEPGAGDVEDWDGFFA